MKSLLALGVHIGLTLIVGAQALNDGRATSCTSGGFSVDQQYPGGNFAYCEIVNGANVEIYIEPEDKQVTNPSPWYAFRIQRIADATEIFTATLKYGDAKHRYKPWFARYANAPIKSTDYRLVPTTLTELTAENEFRIEIPQGQTIYIAAQPNLTTSEYDDWLEQLSERWLNSSILTIGHSIQKRPIHAFSSDLSAPNVILIIGRQHPPEVSGSWALFAFVERLLELRNESCAAHSPSCKFFKDHQLLVVPLVNPDGVVAGHWRHNMGQKDLNRDWGDFEQPETAAVFKFVDNLVASGKNLVLNLDFHSTSRHVLYTQTEDDELTIANFPTKWMATRGLDREPNIEYAPRELTETQTSKNFFYRYAGIPSITFEISDISASQDLDPPTENAEQQAQIDSDTARQDAHLLGLEYADSLIQLMLEPSGLSSDESISAAPTHSDFLFETNYASLIHLRELGLIGKDLSAAIARELKQLQREVSDGSREPITNYLHIENWLIDRLGTDGTNLHYGRSRQDVHGTTRKMLVRQSALKALQSLVDFNQLVVERGTLDDHTAIPTFTHGVVAQATTFAHFMQAYTGSLLADAERLLAYLERMNRSPLGAHAGSGSVYEFDRERLATLLGFQGAVENTFDANFVSSSDSKLELASILANSATHVSQFIEFIHSQQRQARPWIFLGDDAVSVSTSMPQKRNPRPLDQARRLAATVISQAARQTLLSHNVDPGMHDYRDSTNIEEICATYVDMMHRLGILVSSIYIDKERAATVIEEGFATASGMSDYLQQNTDLSLRQSQHFVAELIRHAREKEVALADLSDKFLTDTHRTLFGTDLSVKPNTLRQATRAANFIDSRRTNGGPQRSSLESLVAEQNASWDRVSEGHKGFAAHLGLARFKLYDKSNKIADWGT